MTRAMDPEEVGRRGKATSQKLSPFQTVCPNQINFSTNDHDEESIPRRTFHVLILLAFVDIVVQRRDIERLSHLEYYI